MKKMGFNLGLTILGVFLLVVGIVVFRGEEVKLASGILIGIGTGLIGMCGANLCMLWVYHKHPEEVRRSEIEFTDERNTMIRNKAKAVTCDIIQWFIIGIAFVTIMIKAPLWMTLTVVGVFLLKTVLELYFMNKYQKEY